MQNAKCKVVGGTPAPEFYYKNGAQRPLILHFALCLLHIIYSSAITSTSANTPFGRSFTATQLLAGLEVKYLP